MFYSMSCYYTVLTDISMVTETSPEGGTNYAASVMIVDSMVIQME